MCLVSLYGKAAKTSEDSETWIRQLPLTVMSYELITKGVLDFDYAPVWYRLGCTVNVKTVP